MNLKNIIRDIENFPMDGILYRDITTLLKNKDAFKFCIDEICNGVKDLDFDLIIGAESRGFIFATPIAYNLNKGFIPVRKPGKLPHEVLKKSYSLEYGNDSLEIHKDAIKKGQKIIIIDDLLATGGTCKAIADLVEEMGGIVSKIIFLIELEELDGRTLLKNYNIQSIVKY